MDQNLEKLRKGLFLMGEKWNRPKNLFVLSATKAAFVIIDMQNFSCAPSNGAMPCISEVIMQINRLADFCRTVRVPVIWVRQNITVNTTGDNAGLYPAFHDRSHLENLCNESKGTEIFSEMHFNPFVDYVVFKNRYSAFRSNPPELHEKLDSLKRTQLIVAGIAANVCVESTVRDAMQLDYEVVLVSDGITTFDKTLLESTLKNTMLFFGDVRTTEEVTEALREHAS
jgi:ureidoacrylate peracid hydrolase